MLPKKNPHLVSRKPKPARPLGTPFEITNFSIEEAAAILGVGRSFAFELIRDGRLLTVRLGKRRLVRGSEIERFQESLTA